MLDFVETLFDIVVPKDFKHLFLIEGGAPAVENALKTAFDWKYRKNLEKGIVKVPYKTISFKEAFHGRTGYALSVTQTPDVTKTLYFPRFPNWIVDTPKLKFPLTDWTDVWKKEQKIFSTIERILELEGDIIASIIIEPIQGEGGDNHFRAEFLQGLRRIVDAYDVLLIFDEIQTGFGTTGKWWCFQYFGVEPDIIVFGKKSHVCGILCTNRIDEVEDNVFKLSSRINSTFGGNIVDIVRCTKAIEIIHNEKLLTNARVMGNHFLDELKCESHNIPPSLMNNTRGRGLMIAFDLPNKSIRDEFLNKLFSQKVIALGCGTRSIRFRPPLTVSKEEIEIAMRAIRKVSREFLID